MSPRTAIGLLLLCGLVPAASASPAVTAITVTATSDTVNGDASSVEGLRARPGKDGISLSEAIEATNNDPGTWTIRFAPKLHGETIVLRDWLPWLTGGGVTIEGRGVTLRNGAPRRVERGIMIASSRNRLRGLTVEGFSAGCCSSAVVIQPSDSPVLPTHRTLAGNVVSGLVIRDVANGIALTSVYGGPKCDLHKGRPRPCRTFNRIVGTTISGNRIEATRAGIAAGIGNSGDRVEGLTVTGNWVRISGPSANTVFGISVAHTAAAGDDGTPARISDVLIARNRVEGTVSVGIIVLGGGERAQGNLTQRVRVLGNRVHLVREGEGFCCRAIAVSAGMEARDGIYPEVRPLRYPDRNVVSDVEVRGNRVSGMLESGIAVHTATQAPGSRNRVADVRIAANTISSSVPGGKGVYVFTDSNPLPFGRQYAAGNSIARVTIASNQISVAGRPAYRPAEAGAIVLLGGGDHSRDNQIRGVTIANNRIATSEAGVKVVGGIGGHARGNRVSCVRISGNRVTGARTAVAVISNTDYASGNRASLAC